MTNELPELDFNTFVLSVIGSAYVHLGDAPEGDDGADVNLVLAEQDIQILTLLQDKTKGNLTGDEERVLTAALHDLRARYLEVSEGQ